MITDPLTSKCEKHTQLTGTQPHNNIIMHPHIPITKYIDYRGHRLPTNQCGLPPMRQIYQEIHQLWTHESMTKITVLGRPSPRGRPKPGK